MGPSLNDFRAFTAKDVKKWVEMYPELQKYGPVMERENVTGRMLLKATEDAMKEGLGMNPIHAVFLRDEVTKIIEGEMNFCKNGQLMPAGVMKIHGFLQRI